ncbi:zinc finger, HIT domain containing 1, isoform CRA_d, partial [Mus musculus]
PSPLRGGAVLGTPPWKKGVTRGHRKPEMQTARQVRSQDPAPCAAWVPIRRPGV